MKNQVFLGGTCGKNFWRDGLTSRLVERGVAEEALFNPVLPSGVSWGEREQAREDEVKETAKFMFFLLGNPALEEIIPYSMYAMAQLIESCYNVNTTTRAFFDTSVDPHNVKVLKKVNGDLNKRFPGTAVNTWAEFVSEVSQLWLQDRHLLAFLGGTSGNNPWRRYLLDDLRARGVNTSRFFDPVVPPGTWNHGVQKLEDQMRSACDHEFFFLGDPMESRDKGEQFSTYSAVEAYMGLFENSRRTVVCFDFEGIDGHAFVALEKLEKDMKARFPGAAIFGNLTEAEDWLVREFS